MRRASLVLRGGLTDLGDGRFGCADVRVVDGRIAEVGAALEPRAGEQELDCGRRLVVPGLVNAHLHSNETWYRGRYERLPMEPWLACAYPADSPAQDPEEVYVRTLLAAMEALRCGTTSVVDVLFEPGGVSEASLDPVVRAYRDAGVRATIALGMADRRDPARDGHGPAPPMTWPEWETLARWAIDRHHRPEDGVAVALGPTSPPRCTDAMLVGCRALSDELGVGVHTHLLETRFRALAGRRLYDHEVVAHLDALGFLGPRCCLSHAIWVTHPEIELLAASDVVVVHNPGSNLKLGSGLCPVPLLRAAGVTIALGTDGTSTNDGSDTFEAIKTAALLGGLWELDVDDWPSAAEVWDMATAGGARAVGDPDLGRLQPGARADIALLDLDHAAFTPLNDPLLHLAFSAPSSAVDAVLVGGRMVMEHGRLLGVDEGAVLAEARARAPVVMARGGPAELRARASVAGVIDGWRAALATDVGVNRSMPVDRR